MNLVEGPIGTGGYGLNHTLRLQLGIFIFKKDAFLLEHLHT